MPALFNANMKDQNEPFVNKIKQRIDEQEKIPAISMLVIIIGFVLALAAGSIVASAL